MATESKWTALETAETILDTALNALADDGNKLSAAFSNDAAAERQIYGDFSLYLAEQGVARSAGAHVQLYILSEVDGNYCYGGDALDPSGTALEDSFEYDAVVTARYSNIRGVLLPPTDFKVLLKNKTGQAFAATLNVLTLERYSIANVAIA